MTLPSQLVVEVELPSEARWSRIERELFAKLDERPLPGPLPARESPGRVRALAWAATFAAVAATLVAIFYPGRGASSQDPVVIATTDGTSQATVGESSLRVAPKSLVMVKGDDTQGIDVVLDRGKVTCEVAPRMGRPPFRLAAGEVRVRVVGTKFTVTRADQGTSVDVEEGAVEVTSRGSVTVLHAGEHWPARTAGPLTSAGLPSPPPGASSDATDSSPASPLRAPTRKVRPRHPTPITPAGPDPDNDDPMPADPMPAVDPPAPPPAPAAPVTPSGQEAYEAASRLERTNPDQAAAMYRQIAASHTAWAQIALFALGHLESERGNRAEAARLLNAYLARYPHGINAEDARNLLRRMR